MNQITQSFIAAGAITEFALVSVDTAGKVVVTTAATDTRCIGVAQRAVSTGDAVDVVISGLTRVISGGVADSVSLVMATTAGKVLAHATANNYSIGSVIPNVNQPDSSDGDQILINFTGPQNKI